MMRLFSPRRQLLVIDPGKRSVKFLLVQQRAGTLHIERFQTLEFSETASGEDNENKVREALLKFASAPVAITLPQQLSVSQVIDLPGVNSEQINALIKEETVKLSGLSESGIVYDYGKLNPFGKYQNPFWVTFAKEEEILNEASRLGGIGERLCEITTPANALVAAYRAAGDALPENALLVDLGSSSTVVAVVAQRQGVYALNFPIGSDAFTETISAQKGIGLEAAAKLKQTQNCLSGPADIPALRLTVDGWLSELEKILQDWLVENSDLGLSLASFRVVLTGGGAQQPGLLDYLNDRSSLKFQPWSNLPVAGHDLPMSRFAVSYGTAAGLFSDAVPKASLFPGDLREARKRRERQERLRKMSWVIIFLTALVLLLVSVHKAQLLSAKEARLQESEAVLQEAREVESLSRQWEQAYEQLRPVVMQRQRTLDKLSTLSELQRTRGDQKFWYVLFADQQSYFAGSTISALGTNAFTNVLRPAKYGFVAELSIPQEGEALRQTLSSLVVELKKNPAFTNVDTLPMAERKDLVSTNVVLPGRHFALSIDMAENTFQSPLPPVMPKTASPQSKTNARPSRPSGLPPTNRN